LKQISESNRAAGTVTRIEALSYRSLRYVSQPVLPFEVLVGPNASGKSTFLDVVAFFGDLLRAGLEDALRGNERLEIPMRATDPKHLVWMQQSDRFELAIEIKIPPERLTQVKNGKASTCRYEISVDVGGPARLLSESLWLRTAEKEHSLVQRSLFPEPLPTPESIVAPPRRHAPAGWKKVIGRSEEPERVTFNSETSGWNNPFRLKADKAALMSLPADEERFPVATWVRQFLSEGVQRVTLSSPAMRRPSAPSKSRSYLPDGSNIPWVVHDLHERHPERFRDWTRHVQEALPDLHQITTREREEDRHRYLVLKYKNGLEAPSWLVSDGTLRLLALTLLSYVPELSGIYLIEEPENGIHPRAVETVFQSVSSVYGAQVLLATHSPVILSMAEPDQVLCFARTQEGATDIVRGSDHPRLREWKGAVDLGSLFASGVLG
jgi:predicted ATPase